MRPCIINEGHRAAVKKFERNSTDIYICPDCGCIMADVQENAGQYEKETYYTMTKKDKEAIELKWSLRWKYILRQIKKIYADEGHRDISLLDVGAGNGYFVCLARNEFDIRAEGVGRSSEENKFAKDFLGIDLIQGEVYDINKEYDIVTSFNVIEHVDDPARFLKAVTGCAKKDGLVLISTPNTKCLRARIKGFKRWERIDPPHHINLFPRKALKIFLEREGLKTIKYETLSTYISFLNSKRKILRKIFFGILKAFNLGSDHLYIMRRI